MYTKRNSVTRKIPIPRKGTKYVAVASSHKSESVSVLIALRDILHLARNLSEVKKMINSKLLKLNSRLVKDYRESIRLFNILEADKLYILKILPTKRFALEEVKSANSRICKVVNKRLIKGKKIQLNFHDGSNVISSDNKISVNDSVHLSQENKIISHIPFKEGRKVFITSGKYVGQEGSILNLENSKTLVKLNDKETFLEKEVLVVL